MSNFSSTWAKTMADLEDTFRKWGVNDWQTRPMREVSKRSHWPTSEAMVELRFMKDGSPIILECGSHAYLADNLRVLYYAAEAMRMNEQRGLGDIMKTAYAQIAAPVRERDPYETLGVRPDSPIEVAEAAYRALAKSAHPDAGGSPEQMAALNSAIEKVRNR